jgi:hypothetical protein
LLFVSPRESRMQSSVGRARLKCGKGAFFGVFLDYAYGEAGVVG